MTVVVFWTDALIFLLVVAVACLGIYIGRAPHFRAQWHSVVRSRLGTVSLIVLFAYVAVGLADSIHYRLDSGAGSEDSAEPGAYTYTGEVLSLLDWIAQPLRARQETTYSAPFATHAYVKSQIELADGRIVRDYPRLKFGAAHLERLDQRGADILRRGLAGAAKGLAVVAALVAIVLIWQSRRRSTRPLTLARAMLSGTTDLPWGVAFATVAVLCAGIGTAAELSVEYHVLGTDKVGEDVLYQAIKSIRTGLVIGTLTTLVMLPFAIALGIAAGYFRGWVDDVIQYSYTTLNSIPAILLIAAAILMLQVYMANHPTMFDNVEARADVRLLFLCMILGVTSWTNLCRLLRGESLKLTELDYVQAAVALGVGHTRIIARHLLPNVMHIVLITVVLDFSGLVLAEAVLSYVDIGVDPTMNSWGNMINSARLEMAREPMVWWSLAAAFVFMFTLVLAANLFADSVRDAFDPRLRERVA